MYSITLDLNFLDALRQVQSEIPWRIRIESFRNVALFVRHLAFVHTLSGGRDHSGFHWTYHTYEEIAGWLRVERRTIPRLLDLIAPLSLVVRNRTQSRNEYRPDYERLQQLMIDAGFPPSSWMTPPDRDSGVQAPFLMDVSSSQADTLDSLGPEWASAVAASRR